MADSVRRFARPLESRFRGASVKGALSDFRVSCAGGLNGGRGTCLAGADSPYCRPSASTRGPSPVKGERTRPMANYENQPRYGGTVARGAEGAIDEGLRAHMLRVYNYMTIGLVLTGLTAFGTYSLSFQEVGGQLVPTALGQALFGSAADVGDHLRAAGAGVLPELPHQQDERRRGAGDVLGLRGAARRVAVVRSSSSTRRRASPRCSSSPPRPSAR